MGARESTAHDGIDDYHRSADADSNSDQAPVNIVFEHTLSQCGHEARLGCRQRVVAMRTRSTSESVGMIYEVEHWRNDCSAGNDADDECNLLLPGRGFHELTGLQILEVVVGNAGHRKNHRRYKQREGDECMAAPF